MNKSILLSIKPEWLAKILNGKQTILVMKQAPKNGEDCWWYLYCNKSNTQYLVGSKTQKCEIITKSSNARFSPNIDKYTGNGKVVARFWCDKVEEHRPFFHWCIEKETCLTRDEVLDYLDSKDKFVGNPKRQDKVYAIHISDLEIFDEPRELSEFKRPQECWYDDHNMCRKEKCPYYWTECCGEYTETGCSKYDGYATVTKAPTNYCYIDDFFFDNEETKESESVLIDEKETDGFCG